MESEEIYAGSNNFSEEHMEISSLFAHLSAEFKKFDFLRPCIRHLRKRLKSMKGTQPQGRRLLAVVDEISPNSNNYDRNRDSDRVDRLGGNKNSYVANNSNAIGLVVLTFMLNYFHFGAKLLGYGIVSIIGYCIFLVWLISSAPQG